MTPGKGGVIIWEPTSSSVGRRVVCARPTCEARRIGSANAGTETRSLSLALLALPCASSTLSSSPDESIGEHVGRIRVCVTSSSNRMVRTAFNYKSRPGILGSISNHARVRSVKGFIRKPAKDHRGYTRLGFQKKRKRAVFLHRLVMLAHGPPPPDRKDPRDLVVHHVRGVAAGDQVTNLAWLTLAQNTKAGRGGDMENLHKAQSKRVKYKRKTGPQAQRRERVFESIAALERYLRDKDFHPVSRYCLQRYLSPSLSILSLPPSLSLSLSDPPISPSSGFSKEIK